MSIRCFFGRHDNIGHQIHETFMGIVISSWCIRCDRRSEVVFPAEGIRIERDPWN